MLPRENLARVYWLSGSPCAGKTTISSAIAEKNNWSVYHCDAWWDNHKGRSSIKKHPNWHAYSRLSGDELWLRPVEQHVAEAERAYDEEFELLLEDIEILLQERGKPVIFDGYVSPLNLMPIVPSFRQVFYLIAAEAFQLRYYEQRPWIHEVLGKTSDKKKAWENWMKRDSITARMLETQLNERGIPWLLVDGSITLEETTARVAAHFGGLA